MYEAETDNYRKLALSYHDNPFSVITLNYDVLFEMAAQSVGLDVRYGMDPGFNPKSIPVAKLHGSINWINRLTTPGGGNLVSLGESDNFSDVAASVQTNTIRLGEFNISSIPINMIPSLSHNDLIRSRSDIDEIALIPPFADYKDYHKISGYDKVWNYGGSILQDCDELVIIGCSIRKYDDKLITLLDENLPDEIEVFVFCGPESKKVKEKINVLSENPVLRDASGYFSDYIKKFL